LKISDNKTTSERYRRQSVPQAAPLVGQGILTFRVLEGTKWADDRCFPNSSVIGGLPMRSSLAVAFILIVVLGGASTILTG